LHAAFRLIMTNYTNIESGEHAFNVLLQYLTRRLYAKCFPNKCLSNIKIFNKIYEF